MRVMYCGPVFGAVAVLTLSLAAGPVSAQSRAETLRYVTGAIVGVGAVQKLSAVRWGIAGNIVWAWLFTIPCSAFVAAVAFAFATLELMMIG